VDCACPSRTGRRRGCGWRWRGLLPTFGRRPARWLRPTDPWRRCGGWRRGARLEQVGAPAGRGLLGVVWLGRLVRERRPGRLMAVGSLLSHPSLARWMGHPRALARVGSLLSHPSLARWMGHPRTLARMGSLLSHPCRWAARMGHPRFVAVLTWPVCSWWGWGWSLLFGSFGFEGGHGNLRGVEELRAVAAVENLETDSLRNARDRRADGGH